MKSVKGTQTEKNILTAFSGESQARNRYNIFASKAEEDGFIFVRDIFNETAMQEAHHAKRLFGMLEGGLVEIHGSFPAGVVAATEANLIEAAAGEHEEWSDMYPTFAKKAEEEGFAAIAAIMRHIAISEKYHEQRYLDLAKMIQEGTMFHNPTPTVWRCLHCGCLVSGTDAPKACPACAKPTAWFVRENIQFPG